MIVVRPVNVHWRAFLWPDAESFFGFLSVLKFLHIMQIRQCSAQESCSIRSFVDHYHFSSAFTASAQLTARSLHPMRLLDPLLVIFRVSPCWMMSESLKESNIFTSNLNTSAQHMFYTSSCGCFAADLCLKKEGARRHWLVYNAYIDFMEFHWFNTTRQQYNASSYSHTKALFIIITVETNPDGIGMI